MLEADEESDFSMSRVGRWLLREDSTRRNNEENQSKPNVSNCCGNC